MRIFVSVGFYFVLSFYSRAQEMQSLSNKDTLTILTRSGGNLDSIDLYLFPNLYTHPGGLPTFSNGLSIDFLSNTPNGRLNDSDVSWSKMRFSALPHIGFAYSFGSKGTQTVKANYEHFLGKYSLLNMRFNQLRSNGFIRNGTSAYNQFELQFDHIRPRLTIQYKTHITLTTVAHNGGVLTDSLVDLYGLEFAPIAKTSAESKSKHLNMYLASYSDFTGDTTYATGVYTEHRFTVKNWRYSEFSDTLASLYPTIQFDSTNTSDQFQWSTISNGAGYYLSKGKTQARLGAKVDYWKTANLGRLYDTTEVRVYGEWMGNYKKIEGNIRYERVLFGASNGQLANFYIHTNLGKIDFSVSSRFSDQLPDPFIRYHLGNSISPIASQSWKREKRWTSSLDIDYAISALQSLQFNYSYQDLKDNYFYLGNEWNNTSVSSLSIHQLRVSANVTWKKLHFWPSYTYTLSNNSISPFPSHLVNSRIYVKGYLFKAKKLLTYAGTDVLYQSSGRAMQLVPMLNALTFSEIPFQYSGFLNLHAFAGFQIDQFKFFVRFENIGYFWNDKTISLINNYPLAPFQFRVGITWDFFN